VISKAILGLIVGLLGFAPTVTLMAAEAPPDQSESSYTVYYFHTSVRCTTCIRIEELAKAVVQSDFVQQTQAGLLQFKSVDVQLPANRHFIQDYRLVTKSIVLVKEQYGRPVQWKNLNRVWELIWSESRYRSYIRSEVTAFLGGR
jgi:hypothetical protein